MSSTEGLSRSQALRRRRVSLAQIFKAYFGIGITGFGGGLQARFYHLAVTKHNWLNEEEFAEVNAISSLVPGGNASNVGLEIARRLRSWPGMAVAAVALVAPGTVIMIMVGGLYQRYAGQPWVRGASEGLEVAATALILFSATKLGLKSWRWSDYLIAVATVLGMVAFKVRLFVVLPVLGALSYWTRRWQGR